MDEDISIINSNTRNEKIKNFFIQNKKNLISAVVIIVLMLIGYFGYDEYKSSKKIKVSESYNATIIDFDENNKSQTTDKLIKIINQEDATYSPLALYFIIDNNLLSDANIINSLFDILINKTPVEKEIKNLLKFCNLTFAPECLEFDKNKKSVSTASTFQVRQPIYKTSSNLWKHYEPYLVDYFNKLKTY